MSLYKTKAVLLFTLTIVCVYSCEVVKKDKLSLETINYDWKQSYLGGGGYIVGLLQNPKETNILYARCDVAGMFRSNDRGKSWTPINKGMTECHHHSVESFAISPHNPDILFRCSGEARGHKIFGDIHKSTDGGNSWYPVLNKLDYAGNGPNRMLGEMISVNPFNSNSVAAGGFSKGIYISSNLGESWTYSGLEGEPIGVVAYHPYIKNMLYVGTLSEVRYKDYLYPNDDYKRPKIGKLYLSEDGGKNWQVIFEKEDMEFGDLSFSKTNPETILVAGLNGGVYRSDDLGKTFNSVMNGLPTGAPYSTVCSDPNISGVYYTAPSRRGKHKHIPLVPLYKTSDYGDSWSLIKEYKEEDFSDYPEYIEDREFIGWAISKIRVDIEQSDRLYMSNWFGVSISGNDGKTWSGNNFKGTETICAESIISDSNDSKTFMYTMADHQPAISNDNGLSYEQFVKRIPGQAYFTSSTAIETSPHKPGFILYGLTERGTIKSGIRKTTDYGKTANMVKLFKEGLFVQAIKGDDKIPGTFYAYLDGQINEGAGLYKSSDWGENWEFISIGLPEYVKELPHKKNWIESELLSIVYNQVKNVCGTNQLLAVDPFQDNTLYVGEWTEGLYMTTDDGATWKNIGKNLPFNKEESSTLNTIVIDSNNDGVVYAGFIREGLWRSSNRGEDWEKIYPKDDSVFNATSVIVGGVTNDELYIASEPLYWSKSPSKVVFSNDSGKTWKAIYNGELGALRWKGIAVNKKTGDLQGVTAGNGAFYAKRNALLNN